MRLTCTPPSRTPFAFNNKSSARIDPRISIIASGRQQSSTMAPISPRLFRFGVATDIQYADIPDGRSFAGTPRCWLGTRTHPCLHSHDATVTHLQTIEHMGNCRSKFQVLSCSLGLGPAHRRGLENVRSGIRPAFGRHRGWFREGLTGFAAHSRPRCSLGPRTADWIRVVMDDCRALQDNASTALEAVLQVFSTINCKTFHLLGNHCLYNLPRAHLNSRSAVPRQSAGDYCHQWGPHRIVAILPLSSSHPVAVRLVSFSSRSPDSCCGCNCCAQAGN